MAKSGRSVHFWSDEETEFMLIQLKELNILKCMDGRRSRNGYLFRKVEDQMASVGFKRTSEQIRIRWKNLKQAYLKARRNNQTTAHALTTCPFSGILKELLGRRPLPQAINGVDIGFPPVVSDAVSNENTAAGNMDLQFADDHLFLSPDRLPLESPESHTATSPGPPCSTSPSHLEPEVIVKAEPSEHVKLGSASGACPRPSPKPSFQPENGLSSSPHREYSTPTRFHSLSPFEEQLLAVHREQAAALREGFRALTQQNRLLYLEVCETNRNVARIASAMAEKTANSCGVAEELIRVQQRIGESISSTNHLHSRVIDLLCSQQQQQQQQQQRPVAEPS